MSLNELCPKVPNLPQVRQVIQEQYLPPKALISGSRVTWMSNISWRSLPSTIPYPEECSQVKVCHNVPFWGGNEQNKGSNLHWVNGFSIWAQVFGTTDLLDISWIWVDASYSMTSCYIYPQIWRILGWHSHLLPDYLRMTHSETEKLVNTNVHSTNY